MNGRSAVMSAIRRTSAALLIAVVPRVAASPTEYYNLDFNRPLRVEDAVPTERRSLDVELTGGGVTFTASVMASGAAPHRPAARTKRYDLFYGHVLPPGAPIEGRDRVLAELSERLARTEEQVPVPAGL